MTDFDIYNFRHDHSRQQIELIAVRTSFNDAIGSVGIATAPARMITSEQTLARIGRLMKVSTTIGY
jgi:hypothetical protein